MSEQRRQLTSIPISHVPCFRRCFDVIADIKTTWIQRLFARLGTSSKLHLHNFTVTQYVIINNHAIHTYDRCIAVVILIVCFVRYRCISTPIRCNWKCKLDTFDCASKVLSSTASIWYSSQQNTWLLAWLSLKDVRG